jgi:hypothetical protein
MLIFQYIGFPILYLQTDEYRAEFVNNHQTLNQTFIYSILATSLLLLGFIIGRKICGKLNWATKNKKIKNQKKRQKNIIILFGIICIFLLINYISIIGVKNTALSLIFEIRTPSEIAFLRSEMANSFPGNYVWHKIFFRSVLLVVVVFFLNEILLQPRSILNWLCFVSFSSFFAASSFMTAEKGPAVYGVLTCMVGLLWLKNNGCISFKTSLIFGSIILGSLLVSYLIFMGASDLWSSFNGIISRALTGQLQATYHYVENFPTTFSFLGGTSLPNPGKIFPFTPFNLTQELSAYVFPEDAKNNIVGSMPSVFWVEIYANFGLVACLLASMVVGVFLYLINFLIFQLPYTSLSIAFFSWTVVHYSELSITFSSNYWIDLKMLIIGTLIFFIQISTYKKCKK